MSIALEIIATGLALAYLVLAIREQRACFIAGAVSALLYLWIFWQVQLYMESGLQVFYVLMSGYGWLHWRTSRQTDLPITSWAPRQHLTAIAAIALATVLIGLWLGSNTNAALPFADTFTTVAALVTTWMVTQKVLENWLYWVVIDVVATVMYVDRGLLLTALLFALYTVLAIAGYLQWQRHFRQAALE